ncbi:hypothetical protein M2451_003318 [Dysgonomonas sp. PFB1-18]|uniref:hypothetical protein n=1 Tax=unclassified Dysgonomonas TaxID=2630389 RepID=UPI002475A501|nr:MULTISPECIES: hypothetical protein [unclassified Dysgonomonas]MDH6310592.1 hypothetical protein [Dysgonomonas sp. PF1-14]MDH6340442.1 hypothetical protein [Dysgonomonas sp. PF1-16]MDH6381978.1 hypothetical protein [Dysgonomonas sp. PFB1-18]MDH6399413.1 hypothetical protein [Dysgonomonas sp. PF1-23]
MADTQVKAANLLLERGIRITIPDAPFWDRIRRNNRIHIRPLRAGAIMEIAVLMLENGLDERLTNVELHSRLDVIATVIATAILNDDGAIQYKREALAQKLLWKCPAHVLIKIYRHIESLNQIEGFTAITAYFNRQVRMMMEKRTGQQAKGS